MFDRNKSDEDGSSSSSDDDDDEEKKKKKMKKKDTLKINQKFASRFEHNERRKEEHRLKEKVGKEYLVRGMMMKQKKSDGSSDSDDDDDDESSSSDEGDITETKEKQFVDVLTKLKNKDPSVYDPNAKLYDESSSSSSSDSESDSGPDDSDKKKKKKKKKKMTLREVQARD